MARRRPGREPIGLSRIPLMQAVVTDLLVCPHDGVPLKLDGGGAEDGIERGALSCREGHSFQIIEGVPRLVEGGGEEQRGTFESFSAKWAQVSPEELEQRFVQQYEWFVERYGFGDESGLARFLEGKERILEAGTGVGGDSARFARLCEAEVFGLDLSDGVVAAERHFGGPPNLHYVQADMMHPPFAAETFDFISADQSIHHTPDAAEAFRILASLLREGGRLAVYVYKEKALLRELADTRIRELTTKMSVEECMEFSGQITELGRVLSELDAKVTLKNGVPLLGIEPGEHDVQRLVYWTFLKCFWKEEFSERLNTLVNFDWYHPPYASRHTPEEVEGWCADAGLQIEHLDVSESGISVLAGRG